MESSDGRSKRTGRSADQEDVDVQTPPDIKTEHKENQIPLKTEKGSGVIEKDSFQRESQETLQEKDKTLRTFKQKMSTSDKVFVEKYRPRVEELEGEYFDLRDRLASYKDDGSEGMTALRDEYRRDLEKFVEGVQKLTAEAERSR